MLTIYKASAGSGKTYTLAYEYIKLLLGVKIEEDGREYYVLNHKNYLKGKPIDHYTHRHILAITFTNKATSEMKERIVKQLESLTRIPDNGEKDADYASKLMEEFGCVREELRDVAERSLRSLLNDYSQFNVSTIDAFFQTILRSFAREIDRQGDYRLEIDETTVISEAISMLFDELNRDDHTEGGTFTLNWLEKMATRRAMSGDDFNPFNSHSRMYRSIENNLKRVYDERFLSREKEMYEYLSDTGRLMYFEEWLVNKIKEIEEQETVIAGAVFVPEDMLANPANLIAKIQACGGLKGEVYETFKKRSSKTIENFELHKYGTLARKGKTVDEQGFFSWFDELKQLLFRRLRYEEMLDKINTLMAFVHIRKFIERYRVENNLILISDTNSLLNAIVSEGDTPFIYERVGVNLENFLIDEFQDTSRQQWNNLKPLVSNSLGINSDSLIIGDVKQSIYRWRGGDSVLLESQVQKDDFPINNVKGESDGENTNYRSAHDLVRFNNSLFKHIAETCHVGGYEGVAQSLGDSKDGLSAYIRIFDLTDGKYERVANEYLGEEFVNQFGEDVKMTENDVSLRLMAESIKRQHSAGYRFNEIAILCRDNKSLIDVAEYLVREHPDIKLVSDEALLLSNSPAVKLIISILEIIDKSFGAHDITTVATDKAPATVSLDPVKRVVDSEAEESRRRRMTMRRRRALLIDSFNYYVAHGKSVEDALPLAIEKSKSVSMDGTMENMSEAGRRDLEQDLDDIRKLAPSTLSSMIEAIIAVKLTDKQRQDELPYLTAFIDMVEAYSRDSIPSIHSFLNYWHEHERKFAIAAGEKVDAVSIMTVHKAKGLEWPCVHVPMMKWMFEGYNGAEWFDMDECTEIPADIRPPLMYLEPSRSFKEDDSPFIPQLVAEENEQKKDNLNVTYVAFTRAGRELEIHLADNKDKRKSGKSMADVMKDAFAKCHVDGVLEDIYCDIALGVDKNGNYFLGEPTAPQRDPEGKKKEREKGADTLPPPEFRVSFNQHNKQLTQLADLTMMTETDDDPDLGNNQTDRGIVDNEKESPMTDATRHGLILHSILSQMYTLDDMDYAISYHRRDINTDELAMFRSRLEKAFAIGGEQVMEWFSESNIRVLNEQPIYNAVMDQNRRADRIVWTARGTVDVIDYKFTTGRPESHKDQVRDYVNMLRSNTSWPVRGFLWYPEQGVVERVC